MRPLRLLVSLFAGALGTLANASEIPHLVTACLGRINFQPIGAIATTRPQREHLRVEEGPFENGVFQPDRIWNGDETDWGLNFGAAPVVLRVRLGTF